MYLVTAQEMRAFDTIAIEQYGIPGAVLMENAGRSTFLLLKEHLGSDLNDLNVIVVAGPGNNGGDGYVIARYLINHGVDVEIYLLAHREKIKGDALINLKVLEKMTSKIIQIHNQEELEDAAVHWNYTDAIVDAVLGTGLSSEVRSPYKEALEFMNDSPSFKLAVDLPSGLDSDTGRIMGVAVKADLTTTYGFMKLGMAVHPGVDYCGFIEVVDISIPLPAVLDNPPKTTFYAKPIADRYFQIRSNPEAHKGSYGHVLVVGGSSGKTGAPAMAGQAAARIGAGLVTIGVPASLNPILEVKLTEEMTEPLPESMPGFLSEEAASLILSMAQDKECVVLGPGLSTRSGISELVKRIVQDFQGWLVIDADGLNALAGDLQLVTRSNAHIVLTPHPGEMARLTGFTTNEVQLARTEVARKVASDTGAWVILKGARTVIAFPDDHITINSSGNPWMASGGQGDILSGLLGGLLAQRIPPEEALPLGVFIHGWAADIIVERNGPAPVLATEILAEIPRLIPHLFDSSKDPSMPHGAPT